MYSVRLTGGLLLITLLTCQTAWARAYRCTDAAGQVSYSQVPCTASQQGAQMRGVEEGQKQDRDLCRTARDLAMSAFEDMSNGIEPDAVMDQYGGVNYISHAALGVINFVASLRYNQDLTAQRVGSLTFARCREGGFGTLSEGDFPEIEPDAAPPQEGQPSPQMGPDENNRDAQGQSFRPTVSDTVNRCASYQEEMNDLTARLRRAHDAVTGANLRRERQQYQDRWSAECRGR
ncbi:MAG: DUF4124 domain-containing protein [Gammaproteobacteria bacterium]|nr:DUF4124 domain-containing protein [Gammaproteobacteria bacterium]